MRQAHIYYQDQLAGLLTEDENGYTFQYDAAYIKSNDADPVSLTLPISEKPYTSLILFPFFDGLIPEGWLLDIAEKSWKINRRDRMSLLLACCKDCIGAVSVIRNLAREKLIFTLNAEKKYLEVKLSPSYPIPKQISSNLPNKSYVHKPHLQECKQNCLSIYHRPPTNHNVLLS